MKTRLALILSASLWAACSAPPSQPASLWDSLPPPEAGNAAKSIPAEPWSPSSDSSTSSGGSVGTTGATSPDVLGQVVLNEIFYDSAQSDTDGNLFVELYGSPELDIGGCKVVFVNGADGSAYDSVKIPVGAKIRADGYFLIADARDGSSTTTNVPGADLLDSFDPQNGPDAVQLLDAQGQLVDAVGYGQGIQPTAQNGLATFEGSPAVDVASGHSLERKTPGFDTDDNAADFVEREIPTPGAGPSELPPPPAPAPTPDPSPTPQPPPTPSDPPAPAKVVLNEIFYDPVGIDTDGAEFVELYGSPQADIGGDTINFVNSVGHVYDAVHLPQGAAIPDDGFYVIADARTGSTTETSVVGADFVDNFDPQNGPDAVQLLDRDGFLLDALAYGNGVVPTAENGLATFEGTPSIDVLNGHSLERAQPGLDTDDNAVDFVDRDVPTPGR